MAWALVLAAGASHAQGALLTLVDGEAVITDGARRLAAQPGVRVAAGALVETRAGTLLRLEYADETVVDLGPGTRVMVSPPAFRARSGRPPAIYLLQGWAKVAGRGGVPAGGVVAPRFELLPMSGAAVLFTGPNEQGVFAESGAMELIDRPGGNQRGLAAGALYGGNAQVLPRPPADWLKRVPRAFRDPIPRRAAQFQGRQVDASILPPPTYLDLADWLAAEADVRRGFPQRFATLARDPAFRRSVKASLASHPEWTAVLDGSK